jgi:hypothetical protein
MSLDLDAIRRHSEECTVQGCRHFHDDLDRVLDYIATLEKRPRPVAPDPEPERVPYGEPRSREVIREEIAATNKRLIDGLRSRA